MPDEGHGDKEKSLEEESYRGEKLIRNSRKEREVEEGGRKCQRLKKCQR